MAETRPGSVDAPRLWDPLRHRDFALLWGGFVVSHIGDSVQLHAQNWLVATLAPSGARLGGVAVAQAVPRLLLGLFAGVVVDRIDRRRMLLVTQTLAMAQSLLLFALVATHRVTYAWIVVLAVALGVFDTLNLNARITMMPSLIPRALIGRSVALQALGVNVVQIAGPSLAALLIGGLGITGCFAVNAATFLAVLGALIVVRPPRTARGASAAVGFAAELAEGYRFVRARSLLAGAILLAYLVGFFGVAAVRLIALFARVALHVGGRGYGLLAAATGVGAIAASITVTSRATSARLPRNILAGAGAMSVALGALALAHSYLAAFAALACVGFGQMAFRSAVTTAIQLATPDALRGRVVSLLTLDFSLWSLGALASGALADHLAVMHQRAHPLLGHDASLAWGLDVTFAVMGAVCLLCVALLARGIIAGGRAAQASAPD